MGKTSTIVIGAGVAGLTAANDLAQAGEPVMVLEARHRLGGRIYTVPSAPGPVELGAEFVHGKAPEICELIERARLPMREVAERHRVCKDSKLVELRSFWEDFGRIIKKIDLNKPDQSFTTFLEQQHDISSESKRLAIDFVEGFDAADTERISIHALAREEAYSESINGDQSFRIVTGYDRIVEWLAGQLQSHHVPVHRGVRVNTVQWKNGEVLIIARGANGTRSFEAEHVIITLPLGVLKAGDVKFDPALTEKEAAINGLEMGQVVKVILQFRSQFWPEKDFGFIHGCDEWFPTWWSNEKTGMLTGWAGGPKAERMAGMGKDLIIACAAKAVANIFKVEERVVDEQLATAHFHDWKADPFSRGAYSYVASGFSDAQRKLSEPVSDTLFFAGEATAFDAQPGTVHGAIRSGKRAAEQVLQSLTHAQR